MTIVGARPQFIKAAMVSPLLRKKHNEILLHTGQHFDNNMSELFFEEMEIPRPDYNLGISGGSHAKMTGQMMIEIEEVLVKERPDLVLLYGDTNSTLAGSLSATKLHIPVCHVEAGTRTHCKTNPEEINRICTDHISSLRFVCTELNMEELKKEGLIDNSFLVGDLMYDAFIKYSNVRRMEEISFIMLNGEEFRVKEEYYYLTCHREENTKDDNSLLEILLAMNSLDEITIYPVHPRNKERVRRLEKEYTFDKIVFTEPVGYLESVALMNGCKSVVTDSGGLQREAFFAKKKCVTVLDFEPWPETMVDNRNVLSKPNKENILEKIMLEQTVDSNYMPFGDGHASEKIVSIIDDNNICVEGV